MTGSEVLGRGRFQWNAGGWFGGALGGSAWMFLAAVMLTANDQVLVATVPAAAFLTVTIVAIVLWRLRSQLSPFAGLMAMMTVLAMVIPAVWTYLEWQSPNNLISIGRSSSFSNGRLFAYLLVPILMLWFALMEYSQRRNNQSASSH